MEPAIETEPAAAPGPASETEPAAATASATEIERAAAPGTPIAPDDASAGPEPQAGRAPAAPLPETVAPSEGPVPPVPQVRPDFRHERRRHGLVGPFSGRQLATGFALILVIAVVLIVATTPLGQAGGTGLADPRPTAYVIDSPPAEGLKVGDLAPELVAQRADGTVYQLRDLEGRPIRLADLRGRAVWIDFWASWCPPCQAEMPVIRSLGERYGPQGLTVVAISVQETSEDDVRRYAATYGLTYPVAADLEGLIFHRYKVYALPTQFFIGPDGVIRQVIQGPVDEATGSQAIQAVLPAAPPSAPPSSEPSGAPSVAPAGSAPPSPSG